MANYIQDYLYSELPEGIVPNFVEWKVYNKRLPSATEDDMMTLAVLQDGSTQTLYIVKEDKGVYNWVQLFKFPTPDIPLVSGDYALRTNSTDSNLNKWVKIELPKDGVGIDDSEGATITSEGILIIKLTNGKKLEAGNVIGPQGIQGIGLTSEGTGIDSEGDLIIAYTDGSSVNVGHVIGADGAPGIVTRVYTSESDYLQEQLNDDVFITLEDSTDIKVRVSDLPKINHRASATETAGLDVIQTNRSYSTTSEFDPDYKSYTLQIVPSGAAKWEIDPVTEAAKRVFTNKTISGVYGILPSTESHTDWAIEERYYILHSDMNDNFAPEWGRDRFQQLLASAHDTSKPSLYLVKRVTDAVNGNRIEWEQLPLVPAPMSNPDADGDYVAPALCYSSEGKLQWQYVKLAKF